MSFVLESMKSTELADGLIRRFENAEIYVRFPALSTSLKSACTHRRILV